MQSFAEDDAYARYDAHPLGHALSRRFTVVSSIFLALAVLVICAVWRLSSIAPELSFNIAPAWVRIVLMSLFHACAIPITWWALQGVRLRRLLVPLGCMCFIGFVGMAIGRGSGITFALLSSILTIITVILFTAQFDVGDESQDALFNEPFRKAITIAFVLSIWGLILLHAIIPSGFARQWLFWTAMWLLMFNPLLIRLFVTLRRAMERALLHPVRLAQLLGYLVVAVLTVGFFAKVFARLGLIASRPNLFPPLVISTFYGALIATALWLAHYERFGRRWWLYQGLVITLLLIVDPGAVVFYSLALLLLVLVATGLSEDFYRLLVMLAIGAVGLGVLSFASPWFASEFSHVIHRLQHLSGKRPLPELLRVDYALTHSGWLGQGGGARTWLISSAASKDYALATLLLHMGWLGVLQVFILATEFLTQLLALPLFPSRISRAVRLMALAIATGIFIQCLVPAAGFAHFFVMVGFPFSFGLARSGSALAIFVATLALIGGTLGVLHNQNYNHSSIRNNASLLRRTLILRAVIILLVAGIPLRLWWLSKGYMPFGKQGRQNIIRRARGLPSMRLPISDVKGRIIAQSRRFTYKGRVRRRRVYPFGTPLANVVGWTSDTLGEWGLEAFLTYYEVPQTSKLTAWLLGDQLFTIDPTPDCLLTIDAVLQERIYNLLARRGEPACVVLLRSDGDIIAMVSYPSFDVMKFLYPPKEMTSEEVERLRQSVKARPHELLNRCLRPYAPGSSIKPFILSAYWSEYGHPPANIFCAKGIRLRGHLHKCHSYHGHVNWQKFIVHSCNAYGANVAHSFANQFALADWLHRLGILDTTVLGLYVPAGQSSLPFQDSGSIPMVGYGQTIAVTPLALARAFCALVNDGYLPQLRLVKSLNEQPLPKRAEPVLKPSLCHQIIPILRHVVTQGTARIIRHTPLFGKTGTAQRGEFQDGLFIFGAPYRGPRGRPDIVGIVVLEGTKRKRFRGKDAALVASRIYDIYCHTVQERLSSP